MYVHLINTSVSFVLFMFNELVYSFSHVQIFSIEICKVFLSARHQPMHASTVLGHLDHASISNTRNVGSCCFFVEFSFHWLLQYILSPDMSIYFMSPFPEYMSVCVCVRKRERERDLMRTDRQVMRERERERKNM